MEPSKEPGFWRRQFTGEPAPLQTMYDVAWGIVMPVVCLVMDPVIFKGYWAILGYWNRMAYAFIACEIALLAMWLVLRGRLRNGALLLSGPLLAGGVFALGIHAIMLPLTLRGMPFAIGFLGFTPFLTSFVYFRNAWRALMKERDSVGRGFRISIVLAGMALMLLPSLGVLHWVQNESVQDLMRDVSSGKAGVGYRYNRY
jgi:hypothetical protein